MMIDGDEQKRFLNEFATESDRAAAVLAGAYLDTILEEMIATRLVRSGEGPGGSSMLKRALQTFATRIDAAYCLGLVESWEAADLAVINKIRNAFAHRIHGLTFEDPEIVGLCKTLAFVDDAETLVRGTPTRMAFMTGVVVLMMRLRRRIPAIEQLTELVSGTGPPVKVIKKSAHTA